MLTITTTQTFANAWFAWRLGGFQMAHPEMAVRLMVSDAIVDLMAEDADVAVRVGSGPFPGMSADLLLRVDFAPMCSPEFLARQGGSLEPADLLHLPIISPQEAWWSWWMREVGVDVPDGPIRPGIRLDAQSHEGNAAMAGQGVAMLTPFFWRNDLAEGKLVRPFAHVSTRGYAYWLVVPEHRRNVPKIRRFRDWLLSEVESDLRKIEEAGENLGRVRSSSAR